MYSSAALNRQRFPIVALVSVATVATIACYNNSTHRRNPVWRLLHRKLHLMTTAASAESNPTLQHHEEEEEKEETQDEHHDNDKNHNSTRAAAAAAVLAPPPPQPSEQQPSSYTMTPIGTIRSIYRLCVGTPRQGLLAPAARGRLELTSAQSLDMVDGLEHYSHIWVIFLFHLNTVGSNQKKRQLSKIAPPALGGQKVGVLATRSPHRASRIGMTLCQLQSVQVISKQKAKNRKARVVLHLTGLDLVDGTPVLDIKPYVPHYDSVGGSGSGSTIAEVPSWVQGGLATKRPVVVTERAREELNLLLDQNPTALDFYGPHCGDHTNDVAPQVLQCLHQVLAVDVRSAWQTKKARRGKSQAERAVRVQTLLRGGGAASSTITLGAASIKHNCLDRGLHTIGSHAAHSLGKSVVTLRCRAATVATKWMLLIN